MTRISITTALLANLNLGCESQNDDPTLTLDASTTEEKERFLCMQRFNNALVEISGPEIRFFLWGVSLANSPLIHDRAGDAKFSIRSSDCFYDYERDTRELQELRCDVKGVTIHELS